MLSRWNAPCNGWKIAFAFLSRAWWLAQWRGLLWYRGSLGQPGRKLFQNIMCTILTAFRPHKLSVWNNIIKTENKSLITFDKLSNDKYATMLIIHYIIFVFWTKFEIAKKIGGGGGGNTRSTFPLNWVIQLLERLRKLSARRTGSRPYALTNWELLTFCLRRFFMIACVKSCVVD